MNFKADRTRLHLYPNQLKEEEKQGFYIRDEEIVNGWINGATFHECGEPYGITGHRCRQIVYRELRKNHRRKPREPYDKWRIRVKKEMDMGGVTNVNK